MWRITFFFIELLTSGIDYNRPSTSGRGNIIAYYIPGVLILNQYYSVFGSPPLSCSFISFTVCVLTAPPTVSVLFIFFGPYSRQFRHFWQKDAETHPRTAAGSLAPAPPPKTPQWIPNLVCLKAKHTGTKSMLFKNFLSCLVALHANMGWDACVHACLCLHVIKVIETRHGLINILYPASFCCFALETNYSSFFLKRK